MTSKGATFEALNHYEIIKGFEWLNSNIIILFHYLAQKFPGLFFEEEEPEQDNRPKSKYFINLQENLNKILLSFLDN